MERSETPSEERILQERFERLQRKLIPLWKSIQAFNQDQQSIVVVPSLSVDFPLDSTERQAYEERFLFLLFLLRQPRARMVYVTSEPIQPEIVEYYLGLLPGVIPSHARRRLFLCSPHDGSDQPLSAKLLARPRLIQQIRSLIEDPDRAHLVPFNTTRLERDLALRLGIPMYGADPRFAYLGTKSGCRALFSEASMAHPAGLEGLRTRHEILDALSELRRRHPDAGIVMLKHDEGVAGSGNAMLDLRTAGTSRDDLDRALSHVIPDNAALSVEEYLERFEEQGGIVEQRIVGEELRSPSVQLRITPLGEVELLSTHDQLLGGATGQTFLGCEFPADRQYAEAISREALKAADLLARKGVIGRFAVDFLAARTGSRWRIFAIELNLRKGGTTHPFLTLQFLTDGIYEWRDARFVTPDGQEKFFIATDHLESPTFRSLQPADVFDFSVRQGLHFDQTRETGVVFHMLTTLGRHGTIGLTAVGNTRQESRNLFRRTRDVFAEESNDASRPTADPDD